MALLWCDGFDHYGDDETKMTDGLYDQVDSSFSLVTTNPRTGKYGIRRNNAANNEKIVKSFDAELETVGAGSAFYMSQLPAADYSYELFSLLDDSDEDDILFAINSDGSVRVMLDSLNGQEIASSDAGIIYAGDYFHLEFASRANQEEIETGDLVFFLESFTSGIDDYTFSPSGAEGTVFNVTSNTLVCNNTSSGTFLMTSETISPANSITKIIVRLKIAESDTGAGYLLSFLDQSSANVIGIDGRDRVDADASQRAFINTSSKTYLGSTSIDIGEWYVFTLTQSASDVDYSLVKESDSTVFASGTVSGIDLSLIRKYRFGIDDVAPADSSESHFDDIQFFSTSQIGDADGITEVRVNGVTVISESGLTNTSSSTKKYHGISIMCGSSTAHGVTTDIDDFFIWDNSGSWNNSFIGDRRCFLLKPNQDTNIADFEPSSGSFGYKMIDDESPDDDSSYIIAEAYLQSGSPLTGTSEFEIEDLPSGTSLVSGINVVTRASKTDSTSAEIFTSINSGADSLSQSAHTLTTSYRYSYDIYEYDPATIASLTKDGLDDLSVSITADDLQEEITVVSPDIVSPSVIPGSPTDNDPSIPSDYVARYIFDGDFTDETGTYNGTNSGATFLSAGDGPGGTDFGINVGGGTKQVNLPVGLAAALGSGAGTISFAIRSTATTNVAIVLSGSDTGTSNQFFIPEFGNGTNLFPRVVSSPAGSTSIVRGTTAGAINTWHKVVIRTSGSAWSFRLNGSNLSISVDSGTNNGAWFGDVVSIDNMIIGFLDRSISDTGAQAFDLGFLTLYDRELSDVECEQLEAEW